LLAEQPFTNSTAVINELIELLMPALNSPYAVFGHSMGAILGFELARRIEALKLPHPCMLLVSGRAAPHLPPVNEPIHRLADAEFMAQIRSRYHGIPDEPLEQAEALRLFLPAIRADMRLVETWDYGLHSRLIFPTPHG
jgi:surfactin synthase thioesterase subunit